MSTINDLSDDSTDPSIIVTDLASTLGEVQAVLAPLLKRSWKDTLALVHSQQQKKKKRGEDGDGFKEGTSEGLPGDEELRKAKMNVMVAYAICDLIWIYLRTKGLDPADHPVMRELDRIKTYYIKVREAEQVQAQNSSNEGESRGSQPSTKVNVPAAARVLKHSLGSSATTSRPSPLSQSTASSSALPVQDTSSTTGKASRFKHLAGVDGRREEARPSSSNQQAEDVESDIKVVMDDDAEQEDSPPSRAEPSSRPGKDTSKKQKRKDDRHSKVDGKSSKKGEDDASGHQKKKRRRAADFV